MMIKKLRAKNLKRSGRMIIEKVMIQLGAKSPTNSGGLGGAAAPPMMVEEVMIQKGEEKKAGGHQFLCGKASWYK